MSAMGVPLIKMWGHVKIDIDCFDSVHGCDILAFFTTWNWKETKCL